MCRCFATRTGPRNGFLGLTSRAGAWQCFAIQSPCDVPRSVATRRQVIASDANLRPPGGMSSQSRNATACVSVRIDESPRRCELRNSAPATGHWKCFFQPRMNTGERSLRSERSWGRNGLGPASRGGVNSPLIPANRPVQSHRSVDASVFESLNCDSPQ